MQCQPIFASSRCSFLSRSLFRSIFACQYAAFVRGKCEYLHPSCPCQKQPLTKITVRYFRNTISGCPGKRGWFSLYLNPLENRYFLTIISGLVSLPRIAAIHRCRCSLVSLSIIYYFCPESYINSNNITKTKTQNMKLFEYFLYFCYPYIT